MAAKTAEHRGLRYVVDHWTPKGREGQRQQALDTIYSKLVYRLRTDKPEFFGSTGGIRVDYQFEDKPNLLTIKTTDVYRSSMSLQHSI